ncbi:MAG TPA: cyclic nucleotide-binding domain-containing protein [Spirochaetota bacterium]|nr:cyclic nucleotide-binding domain-containing protein [Spirochaetota bacterium]
MLFTIKRYNKDSILYLELTKPLPYLFIIKSGKVQKNSMIVVDEKEEQEILKEGDSFGFVNCITGQNYLERVTALTETELIVIHKDNIIPFFLQKKDIFLKVIRDYSNKLRNLDALLKKIAKKQPDTDSTNMLIEAAEYFTENTLENMAMYAFKAYVRYSDNMSKVEKIRQKYGFKDDEISKLEITERKVSYKKDNAIFLEQEEGDNFYFIEKGKVKISHIFKNKEIILAILNEGEVFGEMALLNRSTRMASALSFEDCSLLVFDKDNFIDSLSDKILQRIFLSISKRIYHTQRRVINLSYSNPISRVYDCLDYLIASKYGIQRESSFHFYFSVDELKRMIDMQEASDKELEDFFSDYNIRKSDGEIVVLDIEKFYDKVRKYASLGRS